MLLKEPSGVYFAVKRKVTKSQSNKTDQLLSINSPIPNGQWLILNSHLETCACRGVTKSQSRM